MGISGAAESRTRVISLRLSDFYMLVSSFVVGPVWHNEQSHRKPIL
jgi:hypothetical protein